jgi:hypothetical protein
MNQRITRKYKVERYFDTYYDGHEGLFLEEERALLAKRKLERTASPHTKYRVRTVYYLDGKEVKDTSIIKKLMERKDWDAT